MLSEKELKNYFDDPKWSKKAWAAVGNAILRNPAVPPLCTYDKDGIETLTSERQKYAYQQLSADIENISKSSAEAPDGQNPKRQPSEIEMIMMCQILKARDDTQAAVFVRDTLGAKPVDESKVDQTVTNQYEQLSDEELDLILAYRAQKNDTNKETADGSTPTDDRTGSSET